VGARTVPIHGRPRRNRVRGAFPSIYQQLFDLLSQPPAEWQACRGPSSIRSASSTHRGGAVAYGYTGSMKTEPGQRDTVVGGLGASSGPTGGGRGQGGTTMTMELIGDELLR
jgi:hypothetical protein